MKEIMLKLIAVFFVTAVVLFLADLNTGSLLMDVILRLPASIMIVGYLLKRLN